MWRPKVGVRLYCAVVALQYLSVYMLAAVKKVDSGLMLSWLNKGWLKDNRLKDVKEGEIAYR